MIVYVAGYPKSGTTWLTRLLGDALDYPTGASIPRDDAKEPASEGYDRSGDGIVRKGHFVLRDDPCDSPVKERHVMYWRGLNKKEHRVVFIVRDPRDIVVSGAHYWSKSTKDFLNDMLEGTNSMRHVGPWKDYVNSWFIRKNLFGFFTIKYEDLLGGTDSLFAAVAYVDPNVSYEQVFEAYNRQKFARRQSDIRKNGDRYPLGRALNLKLLRKGIAGDWRNHFDLGTKHRANTEFKDLLHSLGYEY